MSGRTERTDLLKEELEQYVNSGIYPFHMPGHKRLVPPAAGLAADCDLTEVEGVDDLHHAQGILRAAMDRTAALFGSARTWYLVGGSTVGNLAAIRAAVPAGSEVLVARNSHKSVFHAIELGSLRAHWLWPETDPAWGISGSIAPDQVAGALEQYPDARAVIVTSPTYEGVVSDIAGIAAVCHRHGAGIPLIVDEAHGAHFGLFERDYFPDSSVHQGADLVVQSAHKTLPSLTQTALLHLNSTLVSAAAVEQQLNIFETSSPSYLLLCSLDGCTGLLRRYGKDWFHTWRSHLEQLDTAFRTKPLRHLRLLCHGCDTKENHAGFCNFDPGKILIGSDAAEWDGARLAEVLRHEDRIETEMHGGRHVLCMTSCCDSAEGFRRLEEALRRIDDSIPSGSAVPDGGAVVPAVPGTGSGEQTALTISEAVRRPAAAVPFAACEGRIAAEYVYPYPPGVPVIVPGERITADGLAYLTACLREGTTVIRTGAEEALTPEGGLLCLV